MFRHVNHYTILDSLPIKDEAVSMVPSVPTDKLKKTLSFLLSACSLPAPLPTRTAVKRVQQYHHVSKHKIQRLSQLL